MFVLIVKLSQATDYVLPFKLSALIGCHHVSRVDIVKVIGI